LLLGLAATGLAAEALAADMPKRKAGLWEINTHLEGMPSMGAMQQCIDQNTDDLMQQRAKKEKPDCSVMDIRPQGNKVTIHSVCKIEGTTATTDATFLGAFDSAYKGDMNTRFSPPMHGMSESKMTLDAKWLGPCKPGQKPGDVTMPNMGGGTMDPKFQEMMKDPKFQEMMKRQK
jgi:hypothetical protein